MGNTAADGLSLSDVEPEADCIDREVVGLEQLIRMSAHRSDDGRLLDMLPSLQIYVANPMIGLPRFVIRQPS
jgi:hypothetical protein